MNKEDDINHDDCETCPLVVSNRRDFLRDTAFGVAAVMATFGLARSASALPVSMIKAVARGKAGISYAIPAADSVQIDRDNEVILARYQNAVYAFNLSCPHQRTALKWNEQDKQFQCSKHHSKYDPKGDFISGRATRGMDRLAIARQGANVVVDIDTMYKEDEDTPQWTAALVKLA
ncbi:MAG TPA: Rieske (2Fe-2S) protein [Gemmatimonadaceae bacterium]|nr:Rieske (2Fe-2S) protein [Gemmatimonadaceae bacterium]